MNDTELDRLLDAWDAPAPAQSLRDGLRARFPRAERIRFARPLRWGLVALPAFAAVAMATAQSGRGHWDDVFGALYDRMNQMVDAHRTVFIVAEIRGSEPKVYVDGELAAPLEYGNTGSLRVQIPGEGAYSVTVYRYMKQVAVDVNMNGWTEAGTFHGNVLEFEAGGKQVRIECNRSIIDGDRPVFVRRQTE